jgi:plastocyanin
LAVGCGGNKTTPATKQAASEATAAEAPVPSGCGSRAATVSLVAENLAYDKSCVAVPANQPVTITLDNKDPGVMHNVAVYAEDVSKNPGAKVLFRGDMVTHAGSKTYQVAARGAGSYYFRCDVHPTQMTGTYSVG